MVPGRADVDAILDLGVSLEHQLAVAVVQAHGRFVDLPGSGWRIADQRIMPSGVLVIQVSTGSCMKIDPVP
ncbi:hypothetical protein DPM13_09640 [Paracoccus mutanolyticus]|uniref:NfeD-like C-terminal domain-containing protein n=1 Tax=Paracoccus mutanolyticus TaxID=1499308 RepID=A0ABM6WRG6_9RHOB|nr:hypothetical protein [Paracoccus mutanolyticus]AWX93278.1 hypothetical protein DPM13_09640 [Paracoccus mutanolyticus]